MYILFNNINFLLSSFIKHFLFDFFKQILVNKYTYYKDRDNC